MPTEKYIKKIGLSGSEDVCTKSQIENNKERDIDSLYLIQLFDYNCPSCVSGVTKVFVEDIEEFARIYQNIEKDNERVERFMKSKSGETISDYYSDAPGFKSAVPNYIFYSGR